MLVADIRDEGRNWFQSFLSLDLPKELQSQIQEVPFSLDLNTEDVSCWAFSKDGSFSLKSAYLLAKGLNPLNPSAFTCEWIWKAATTPRIMFFLWLSIHNSVPTCEVLGSRGFTLDTICPIYRRETETLQHIIRDY